MHLPSAPRGGAGNTHQEADEVIGELIESFRKGEVWVFAGAGISVHSGGPRWTMPKVPAARRR